MPLIRIWGGGGSDLPPASRFRRPCVVACHKGVTILWHSSIYDNCFSCLKIFSWELQFRTVLCYSLISIRQNYNFDMLAMIWHEIVCWFLKIYQDLKRFSAQEHRIVFILTFRCAKQFYVPNMQEQSKAGKKSEINGQTFIIWCEPFTKI